MSLTSEDKQWIRELLSEQSAGSEARYRGLLEASEARYRGLLEASEARFREQLEGVETRLLTEFHKWASPLESRQRTHGAAIRTLDLEFELLADRVTKLEENQKPAQ
jgi:hypothetical protein